MSLDRLEKVQTCAVSACGQDVYQGWGQLTFNSPDLRKLLRSFHVFTAIKCKNWSNLTRTVCNSSTEGAFVIYKDRLVGHEFSFSAV